MDDEFVSSALDSRRFGKNVWRATVTSPEGADRACAFDREAAVDLMIARVPSSRIDLVQRLELSGFFVCDVLVWYRASLPGAASVEPAVEVREYVAGDAARVETIARTSFREYPSHYHADARLDRSSIVEGYVEWAMSGRERMLVSLCGGTVSGFLSWKQDGARGEIVLNAVAQEFRGRGCYDALVKGVMRRMSSGGAAEVAVSTQLANAAPQRTWMRNGFEIEDAWYTLHRWFGAAPGR